MNFATSSEGMPQRSNTDSVWRTQESGDSEIRQRVFRIRLPRERPSAYQTPSAMSEAATATRRTFHAARSRSTESAPATMSTGIAGIGAPSCSSSTIAEDERESVRDDVLRQLRHGSAIISRDSTSAPDASGEALRYRPCRSTPPARSSEIEADAVRRQIENLGRRLLSARSRRSTASKGRLCLTGIGKSGLIGQKIAATLASTGTPAYFLHAGEASHGDLGMLMPGDVVLALSYSGETPEVVRLLEFAAGSEPSGRSR